VGASAGELAPAAVLAADVPAFHFDDCGAETGPGDDKVGLMLCGKPIIATECSSAASSGS
jgi:hypothetical protein